MLAALALEANNRSPSRAPKARRGTPARREWLLTRRGMVCGVVEELFCFLKERKEGKVVEWKTRGGGRRRRRSEKLAIERESHHRIPSLASTTWAALFASLFAREQFLILNYANQRCEKRKRAPRCVAALVGKKKEKKKSDERFRRPFFCRARGERGKSGSVSRSGRLSARFFFSFCAL